MLLLFAYTACRYVSGAQNDAESSSAPATETAPVTTTAAPVADLPDEEITTDDLPLGGDIVIGILRPTIVGSGECDTETAPDLTTLPEQTTEAVTTAPETSEVTTEEEVVTTPEQTTEPVTTSPVTTVTTTTEAPTTTPQETTEAETTTAPKETTETVTTEPETSSPSEVFVPFDVPLSEDLQKLTVEIAKRFDLAPELLFAIMQAESNYNVDCVGKDAKYLGIMQVAVSNLRHIPEEYGVEDLMQFEDCVTAGAYFLRYYTDRYECENEHISLLYYHGGPGYALNKLKQGVTDDAYTRKVVAKMEELIETRAALAAEMGVTLT